MLEHVTVRGWTTKQTGTFVGVESVAGSPAVGPGFGNREHNPSGKFAESLNREGESISNKRPRDTESAQPACPEFGCGFTVAVSSQRGNISHSLDPLGFTCPSGKVPAGIGRGFLGSFGRLAAHAGDDRGYTS